MARRGLELKEFTKWRENCLRNAKKTPPFYVCVIMSKGSVVFSFFTKKYSGYSIKLITLYKAVLTFESVHEILKRDHESY